MSDSGEITRRLQATSALQSHLANIISGLNHEVSPWLGSINNTIDFLRKEVEDLEDSAKECDNKLCEHARKSILHKIKRVEQAAQQATIILSMTSMNIKKLQNYANNVSNLRDTVHSWIKVTLLDTQIKDQMTPRNLIVDEPSLDFFCTHSPMLLSQVILNLAKNSIEHNQHMLDDLVIRIYGKSSRKFLIYEDNGKGIETERLQNLFEPGVTSKDCKETSHGLGLSACLDYCISMGAIIWASSEVGEYTRFIISFDKANSGYYQRQDSEYELPSEEMMRHLYKDSGRLFTKGKGGICFDNNEGMPGMQEKS